MQPNTETGRSSAGAALLLPMTLSFIYRHYCPVLQHQLPYLHVLLLSRLHYAEDKRPSSIKLFVYTQLEEMTSLDNQTKVFLGKYHILECN